MGFIDDQSELERMLSNLQEEVGDTDIENQHHIKEVSKTEDINSLIGEVSSVLKQSVKTHSDKYNSIKKKPLDTKNLSSILDKKVKKPFSSTERKSNSKTGKAHILVVDDDIRVLKMMQEILKVDYDVSVAPSGRIALNFLERHGTDLILLDYLMPGMNGKEVLEEIRLNPSFSNTPVFFLTGVSDRGTVENCLKLRPRGYMLKPVKRDELLTKLKIILD